MKVSVVNLGCKVNRVESDSIALAYLNRGATIVDAHQADTIVVNTCTVTGEAEKKTRKTIRKVLRENQHAQVMVTGCAAVIDPDFFKSLDKRIAVIDKTELLDAISADETPYAALRQGRVGQGFPTRVAVKVQDGCNHSCTYCIVHVARGRAWSRPYADIEQEVLLLASEGVKEMVLAGIDLGSYSYVEPTCARVALQGDVVKHAALAVQRNTTSEKALTQKCVRLSLANMVARLLAALDKRGYSDVRLRISSIEPRSINQDFIDLLGSAQGRVCRHLHLPLQSGSDKVLRQMNRPYTAKDYLDLVDKLKAAAGDISLSTDVIVGFPGESDEDFDETLKVVQKAGFTKVHVFRYSRREGTPAAERSDQVDAQVKEARAHQLIQLADDLRRDYVERNANRRELIVAEREGWGMSESYYKVRVDKTITPGSVIQACLTDADPSGMVNV